MPVLIESNLHVEDVPGRSFPDLDSVIQKMVPVS